MGRSTEPDGSLSGTDREREVGGRRKAGRGSRALFVVGMSFVAVALGIVIVAPIALSSQDLVRWASDPEGLGLPGPWAWLAFVALDAAAAVCVAMVTVAAWRGESGGAFHAMTWLFAVGSAVANHRHGATTPARDDEYFFPAMSIAGPLLLDVTLARIRRWARIEARTQMTARPRFGLRWLPGVGFRETLRAWQASLREDIARPADAIAHVREVDALAGLDPADALRFAWQALGHTDPYVAWQWLVARGVTIDQATILTATRAVSTDRVPSSGAPAGQSGTDPVSSALAAPPGKLPRQPAPGEERRPVIQAPRPRTRDGRGRTATTSPSPSRPSSGREVEIARRLRDAMELLRGDPDLTAAQLGDELRRLGWDLSARTAARVLSEARARSGNAARLAAVR